MVQKTIEKLSQCKYPEGLAFCPRCETFYIDDLPQGYTIKCPKPKCGRMLIRDKFVLKGGVVVDDRGKLFRRL